MMTHDPQTTDLIVANQLKIVGDEELRRAARILGPRSASARALADLERRRAGGEYPLCYRVVKTRCLWARRCRMAKSQTTDWLRIGLEYLAANAAESGADVIIEGMADEIDRLRAALREIAAMDAGEAAEPRTGASETAHAALGTGCSG